jgi:phosphoglycolate phosphatase
MIFDLDGTLLDTIRDIEHSVNDVRAGHGLAPLTQEMVRAAVGKGVRVLLTRTVVPDAPPGISLDSLVEEMLARYRVHCVKEARPYPGAIDFLRKTAPHVTLAMLTNKPLEITRLTIGAAGIAGYFEKVVSPENARGRKPDPAGLLGLLEDLEVKPAEALFFGDSVNDFAAGRDAGVTTIGLRIGYYSPGEPDPDLWVEDWAELHQLWDDR